MALRTYKPVTPSLRGLVQIDRSELWKGKPIKALHVAQVLRDALKNGDVNH